MLLGIFHYLTASLLAFQGLQALGEQREPLGVVPEEVRQNGESMGRWGGFLLTFGLLSAAIGLLGSSFPWHASAQRILTSSGLAAMAIYGLWIVFLGRRVAYLGKP